MRSHVRIEHVFWNRQIVEPAAPVTARPEWRVGAAPIRVFEAMDISRQEQRILHTLAQGGHILALKDGNGRILDVECYTRDGWVLTGCPLWLFKKLKRKKAIRSQASKPYRITRRGLELVRAEVDNK